jgi:muramoyltetrapeptide carboxypeptidase
MTQERPMPLSRRQWIARAAALTLPARVSATPAVLALGGAAAVAAPAVATATATAVAASSAPPLLRPRRLQPGDTIALINPSGAIHERRPYEIATETLQALGFKVREAPHLRARRGHLAGTDAQRAGDVNAMFADPGVHGLLAMTGGSGGARMLPAVDYDLIRRNPKFLGGFSDLTALINAVTRQTGLVTFHAPMGASEWNAFSVARFRELVMEPGTPLLTNPPATDDALVPRTQRTRTLHGGKAQGHLVGGNLAVLAGIAGSAYWPRFDGAILFLEEINEYIYRVDRMLSTLALAGAFDRLAGVVIGAFTNCGPGEGFGRLTLDEVFDDHFGPLGVPVYSGASFGHIRLKWTLPVGLPAEMDADAGTLQILQPAVT